MSTWIDYVQWIGGGNRNNVKPEHHKVKRNNNAPKNIKGDYDLTIHGNKIVLVDNVDGTTVEAKCHPDDDFDISVGIKQAFDKLNDERKKDNKHIQVGDWVEVTNHLKVYPTYPEWLYERVDFYSICKYAYGCKCKNGEIGQVIAIGKHNDFSDILVAFCTAKNRVYIVGEEGVRKVRK